MPIPYWQAYRLRWKRRRLLWRSFRSRHQLRVVANRTKQIKPGDILVALAQRSEALRLPHFIEYYRKLGADHFLVVDNDSSDGSREFLAKQPDVSIWQTDQSYRSARFGLDWVNWLLMRYAHGHWTLTVDADELLVFSGMPDRSLRSLTQVLEARQQNAMGTLMIDLFPEGSLGKQGYAPGDDPLSVLTCFDAGDYTAARQNPLGNLWVQGGTRRRVFFDDNPAQAPTLNKLPLVFWNRRYAFVNSTHSILPRALNAEYDGPGDPRPSGVLLHTKFLPDIVTRSAIEAERGEHFTNPAKLSGYYERIGTAPVLWHDQSERYEGPQQLIDLGLMSAI